MCCILILHAGWKHPEHGVTNPWIYQGLSKTTFLKHLFYLKKARIKPYFYIKNIQYSWPLNNTHLNYMGFLIRWFFSIHTVCPSYPGVSHLLIQPTADRNSILAFQTKIGNYCWLNPQRQRANFSVKGYRWIFNHAMRCPSCPRCSKGNYVFNVNMT